MSTNFFIKNINNKAIPTIRQILEIGQTISQYDISEDSEEYEDYLDTRLDDIEFILLGQEGASARGFEFSFDAESNCYCIRAFSPCSTGDFNVIFNFIRDLGNYLENTKVTTDNDDEYNINNIEYPYYEHIMLGIEQVVEIFKRPDQHTIEVYGIHRPVSFDEKMFTEVLNSDNPVEKFSKIITDIQYLDAFSANQILYKTQDGTIIGVYTLTETVTTVLPYKPTLDYKYSNIVKAEDVHWEINLVVVDKDANDGYSYDVLRSMKYPEFIKKLPKDKYHFIDASYIVVDGLSREEIENLLKN